MFDFGPGNLPGLLRNGPQVYVKWLATFEFHASCITVLKIEIYFPKRHKHTFVWLCRVIRGNLLVHGHGFIKNLIIV